MSCKSFLFVLFSVTVSVSLVTIAYLYIAYQPVYFCVADQESPTCKSVIPLDGDGSPFEEVSLPYYTKRLALDEWLPFVPVMSKTAYQLNLFQNETCKLVAARHYTDLSDKNNVTKLLNLLEFVRAGFDLQFAISNVPVHVRYTSGGWQSTNYTAFYYPGCVVDKNGVGIGACKDESKFSQNSTFYIFNHISFDIYLTKSKHREAYFVSFVRATPKSLNFKGAPKKSDCETVKEPLAIRDAMPLSSRFSVYYTYSVTYILDNDSSRAPEPELLYQTVTVKKAIFYAVVLLAVSALINKLTSTAKDNKIEV